MRIIAGFIAACWVSLTAYAVDINASSASLVHVQAAVDLAITGDRVLVPAGTAIWTNRLAIVNKGITLEGAGIGMTLITNQQGTSTTTTPSPTEHRMILVTAPATGRVKILGFTFDGNKTSNGIFVQGDTTYTREVWIESCHFKHFRGRAVQWWSLVCGLINNCTFMDNFKTVDVSAGTGGSATDTTIGKNISWNSPLTMGTIKTVVIEDCAIWYSIWTGQTAAATASHGHGGRACWRYNVWTNNIAGKDFFPIFDMHGNQKPLTNINGQILGEHRSGRQLEVYANQFFTTVTSATGSTYLPADLRGGTHLFTSNIYTGSPFTQNIQNKEEDGPLDFDWYGQYRTSGPTYSTAPTNYPGWDPHHTWNWANTVNGSAMGFTIYGNDKYGPGRSTTNFCIRGTNLFDRPPQSGDPEMESWTPLTYPHPWRSGSLPPTGTGTVPNYVGRPIHKRVY